MIAIDRDGDASALRKMAAQRARSLAKGRAVVIFPEGTRKKPGAAARLQARRRRTLWPARRRLRAGGAQFRACSGPAS